MVYIVGIAAFIAILLGGTFALHKKDQLHLILGFSAGAVIGVAFFGLLPESIALAQSRYEVATVTTVVAIGFLVFMFLNRVLFFHPHADEDQQHIHQSRLGAGSLALHSLLDGISIGLAFQVSNSVGLVVAAAILAHGFSDGINTISFILKKPHDHAGKRARRWLVVDAAAPLLGIFAARFFSLSDATLGLVLALFCGFFLYIGASDLVPESHHRHPQLITSLMTILGALVIYGAIRFAA